MFFFFFSSRRRHTRYIGDWSSDVCSSDLALRQRTQDILAQTYRRFAEAEMLMGFERLTEASLTVQDRFDVEASTRNVIGVRSEERRVGKEWWCRGGRGEWRRSK